MMKYMMETVNCLGEQAILKIKYIQSFAMYMIDQIIWVKIG